MKKLSIISATLFAFVVMNAHATNIGTVIIPPNGVKTSYPVIGLDTRFYYSLSCLLNIDADETLIEITPHVDTGPNGGYVGFILNDEFDFFNNYTVQTKLKNGDNTLVSTSFKMNNLFGFDITNFDSKHPIKMNCDANFWGGNW